MTFHFFRKKNKIPIRSLNEIKEITKVLFIDDTEFDTVQILENQGWYVRWVNDIDNLDCIDIKESHIIFVDIHGVGRELNLKKEGLTIITAIKEKYPYKKVVAYSANPQNGFDPDFKNADDCLPKDADTYQFIKLLERFACDLFSYDSVIKRIQEVLKRETGQELNEKEIAKILKKDFSEPRKLAKLFGTSLEAASYLIPIIELFMQK